MAKRVLSRRHVLRGAGVSLALPLLNAMTPISFAADSQFKPWKESTTSNPRAIFCYVPNGVNILQWMPSNAGAGYELSPTLKTLEPLREEFSILSGLGHPNSTGGHSGADTWLTGANLKAMLG